MKVLSAEEVKALERSGDLEPEEELEERRVEALETIAKQLGYIAANARGGRIEDSLLDLVRSVESLKKAPERPRSWVFHIERDDEGRVKTINAEAK